MSTDLQNMSLYETAEPDVHAEGEEYKQGQVKPDTVPTVQVTEADIPAATDKADVGTGPGGIRTDTDSTDTDRLLNAVAVHLDSPWDEWELWERLALSLGLKTDYIRDLKAKPPTISRPRQLMVDWKKRNDGIVTLDQLEQALRAAGIHAVADAVSSEQLFMIETDVKGGKVTARLGIEKERHDNIVEESFEKVVDGVSHKWDDLARELGFRRTEIKGLRSSKPNAKYRCREMLDRWRDRKGSDATLQVLKQALINIGERQTTEMLPAQEVHLRKEFGASSPSPMLWTVETNVSESQQRDDGAGPSEVVWDTGPTVEVEECFGKVVNRVSHKWVDLAQRLGLSRNEIIGIRTSERDDDHRCWEMLDSWRNREGREATLQVLKQALIDIGERLTADEMLPERDGKNSEIGACSTPSCSYSNSASSIGRLEIIDYILKSYNSFLSIPELQKSLKKYYELKLSHFKPLIWNDNFTLTLSDIFTQLELVPTHGKHVSGPKEYLRSGERKEIKSLDGLFNPDVTGQSTAPRCILIDGEPGVGKTTFLSKEALDAVSQKTELGRRHDLVLLLRLREVREETIEEMVWDQCVPQRKDVTIDSIKTILEQNESRVLFLLDGYDELQPDARAAGQAIPKLLSGKLYPNSTIVITSRPSVGVEQHTRPDCHVQIMGFSSRQVEKYVRKYFITTGKHELAEKLLTVISERHLLTDLIHTPTSLMFVCILFEEDPEMISTGAISGLYDNYLTVLARKYCKREGVDMPTEGLSTEVAESLLQFGKLALEALLRNETLLDLTEVEKEKVNWELLLKLGVVCLEVSSSKLHPRKQLDFSHKTMQEFLAGRYVAHALLNQDIVDLLQLTSITKALELSNLLLFTCGCDSRAAQAVMEKLGKLSIKEFPEQVESSNVPMDQGTQKSSKPFEMFEYLCLNILRERQEPEMLHAISKIMPIVMLNSSINSRVATALKYYIRNLRSANLPDRLILKIHGGTDSRDTVQYLQQCFTTPLPGLKLDLKLSGLFALPDKTTRLVSVLKNVPGLRLLDLSDTKLTPSSLQPLVQGFRHMSLLEELDLSGNPELRDSGMDVLQVGLHIVPHLAVLRLRKVSMTAVGLSFLAPCMYHLAGLREVDVSGNRLLDKGMEVMADIIKRAIAMKVLILGRTYISGKGILSLVKVLPHLSKLQVLDVRFNSIEDSEMVTLVQTLCQPSSLDTKQDPPGDKILTASHSNNQLRQLYIGGNSGVTGAGLGRVAQLISALPALTTLDMSGHKDTPAHLSDTAAMGLAKALHTLPVLEMLDLRYISMEPAGFQAVVRAAEEHPVLRKLL
ncbi:NLR family CARD domain-containing protein 4-like [Branchiostoma floridae]|uniref:NLR family CARD domain-containing protein 4-like n=1 Tax=Branchiostoma floridae TaxID=7739 RepID=A0A9J7HVR4_BRAFL|nr:NLR family CARD domain-containing protein 4-like [Branchiostoma floridae]